MTNQIQMSKGQSDFLLKLRLEDSAAFLRSYGFTVIAPKPPRKKKFKKGKHENVGQ